MSATLIEGWRINETSGSTIAGLRGVLDLTLDGGSFEPGTYGSSYLCDANGDKATATAPDELRLQPPLSFVIHGRRIGIPTNNASFGGLYHNAAIADPFTAYAVGFGGSLVMRLLVNDDGVAEIGTSVATVPLNQDLQLAAIIDSNGDGALYLDGTSVATVSIAGAIEYGADAPMIIGSSVSGRNTNFRYTSAGVWSGVLTAQELTQMQVNPKSLGQEAAIYMPSVGLGVKG